VPLAALVVGMGILTLTYAFASFPFPKEIPLASSAKVYDRDGSLIGTYTGEQRRFLIDTKELLKSRPFIGHAVVAAEDKDFYAHNGVSVRGMARAAWANLTGGEITQGGSTITQQYVKNAVLADPSRTVMRKFKEAILAIKAERRFSKREILGFYLNTIYLGRGAYGIEAAAQTYFDKHARELDLGEAAYLAGIIPAPESYQPDEDQFGAQARRDHVLQVMVEEGYISSDEADRFIGTKVKLAPGAEGRATRNSAAYFMEWLRKEYLYPKFGEELYTRGLKIYTTLDMDVQDSAEDAVASILTEPGDPEAALVSMEPTGEVRAFVGGRSFTSVKKARGFNFAATFPGRETGSTLKPFTLLSAIKEGISPQSRFSGSSPAHIDDPDCPPDWEPENYGGTSYGTITLDEATTNSVNAVFARLVAEIGPEKVAATLEDFRFHPKNGAKEITPNCSLALGSFDSTVVEMARAYAGFAGRGMLPRVTPIRFIADSEGNCWIEYIPQKDRECDEQDFADPVRVAEQNSVDVLTQVLTHVVQGGTATAANIGRPVAGKTGTAQENVNAWFSGYVPQLSTVVWMGYPAQKNGIVPQMRFCADAQLCRPVHGAEVTGGGLPAMIWAAFMREAVVELNLPPAAFPIPEDMPDDILNPAPPPPTATPKPTKSESPEPSPTPKPSPSPKPSSTPKPSPSPKPSATLPPSPGGGGGGGDGGGGAP
jgi:penicillin-binding protein 1A